MTSQLNRRFELRTGVVLAPERNPTITVSRIIIIILPNNVVYYFKHAIRKRIFLMQQNLF